MRHTKDTIAIRAWELRKQGLTDEQVGQQIADELAKESIGYSITEARAAVNEAEELYAAHVFMQRHPEWKEVATDRNVELLEQRAHEINDGAAYDLGALEIALYDLADEGAFETPEPKPQPVSETAPAPAPTQQAFTKSGRTGTLTSPERDRAELNKLSLAELKRRAAADRWANMNPTRRKALRTGFTVVK